MQRIDFRPALLWLSLSFGMIFALGLVFLAITFSPAAPFLQEKYDSLHYRLLALLPPPPHTEFVPTPLPTPTALAQLLDLTPTLAPSDTPTPPPTAVPTQAMTSTSTAVPTPAVVIKPVQPAVQLTGVTHDYQRWNNCGPTTLEMYLSFFGKHVPQLQIASVLKPDPNDKNVRPDEMAAFARSQGFNVQVRENGTLERIKLFLSNGLPLIVETGFDPPQAHEGWMGHYRLVMGYNDKNFITQDSYDGPNVQVAFADLDSAWHDFNRTYILLYTNAQAPLARAILGEELDDTTMYAQAVARAQQELAANPKDAFAAFNLGTSLLGLQRYNEAAAAFDQARLLGLPWRMLWYQFGPYEAYLQVGRYQELTALADATLKVETDLEESHYYKGLALEKLGQPAQARAEFALALQYNKNYTAAQHELTQLAQQ
jgi:uncharacterized protein YvpB